MLERADLYDPALVARLARAGVAGPPAALPQRGIHPSPRRGTSLEFSEHTEYSPGDDLRHLDWRVVAKTDRYYLKRYEDERLQRAVLVVDASGSMAFGAGPGGVRGSKYHHAARIAVAMAAALVRQGDAVGLVVAGGGGVPGLPVRRGRDHLAAVVEVLGGVAPGGRADLAGVLAEVARRAGRSAAVFLVSDLLDPEAEGLEPVAELRARGLSPRVVHLLHPDEIDLPYHGTTRFRDLEGPAELVLDPEAVRRAYRDEIRSFVRAVAVGADRLGIPYAFLSAGDDPADGLVRLLRRLDGARWSS